MKAFILSAGQSKRFSEAGCTVPKHLLPMPDGAKLIEWQEDRMLMLTEDVTTVVLKEHEDMTRRYIRRKLVSVAKSNGPLDTFFRVAPLALGREPVIVIYNDHYMTFQEYKIFADLSPWLDAAQVVFSSHADRFNYVYKGYADGGVYKFRNGTVILKSMARKRPPYTDKDGMYMLVERAKTKTYMISSSYRDLGVPSDYKLWMAEEGNPVHDW